RAGTPDVTSKSSFFGYSRQDHFLILPSSFILSQTSFPKPSVGRRRRHSPASSTLSSDCAGFVLVCSCDSVNSRAPNGPSNWSSHRLFLVNINSNNLAAMKTLVVKPYFFRRRQRSLPINSPSISAATKPSGFVTLTHRHRPSRDSTVSRPAYSTSAS